MLSPSEHRVHAVRTDQMNILSELGENEHYVDEP